MENAVTQWRRACLRIAAVAATLLATGVAAQTTFPIQAYRVLGNSLLSAERIAEVTRPYVLANGDFETIQSALESLEKAYVAAGYGSVRVEIPEQELDEGTVTLQVIEGVLGAVQVDPNPYFDAENVTRSLPALKVGESVNIFDLNRNLVLANESGSKVAQVTFKRSANSRDVDVHVKLAAEDPERWIALLENTGSESTGWYRTGLIYQNGNLFNRDHSVSVQAVTSPEKPAQVSILGLSYKAPLYAAGITLDLHYSHSSVNSGQVAQAGSDLKLDISGSGDVAGARLHYNLDSSASWQHKVSAGLEWRAYGNQVLDNGSTSLVPDMATHPFTLGYSGTWKDAALDASFSLTWLANIPGGSNGTTEDLNRPNARSGANASFQTFRIDAQVTRRFVSDWALRAALSSQTTGDLLISPEQFGLGGADSVRGFRQRDVSGDQGWRVGLEAWAPPWTMGEWQLIPVAFVDQGGVTRNQPAPDEVAGQTIGSAGLGLRATWKRHFIARLDWGYITQGVNALTTGGRTGDSHLHAMLLWIF